MIARIWRGWTTAAQAEAFEGHVRRQLPTIQAQSGYCGLTLLRLDEGEEVQFVTVTTFASMDDVVAFAGPNHTEAVIPPALRQTLHRVGGAVEHYEVVLKDG